ncbi:hypothetical protein LTR97_009366 [Elasticomyces elasticus]|uniref:Glycosyl transferase CAP10 domain-containing protein n=1 Tax=Elasticomyces elasticus TaxID=574655 RepID=A0AAN8A1B6_9PEZI|nr:hypothetical protein LTR97_009366 [Elasticomyces elasticus]
MAPKLETAFRGHSRPRWLVSGGIIILLFFVYSTFQATNLKHISFRPQFPSSWTFDTLRDERNLGLSDAQCDAAFPGLYAELERARDYHALNGGINISQIAIWTGEPGITHAQTRVLLYNGNLHVVGDKRGYARRERVGAALSNLHRAISAIPDARLLPNIEFTIDTLDDPNPRRKERRPGRTAWSWDRHVSDEETWVMPDFGGWSYLGGSLAGGVMGYNSFRDGVEELEADLASEGRKHGGDSWEAKVEKALWRGTVALGNSDAPRTRQDLVKAADGRSWSDVQAGNFVKQVEHCRWQYLIHTEGFAWGGRLRYLLNCNSSVIIPWPLHFVAHFYPLLQSEGSEQNFIPVKSDWSDLDETIESYRSDADSARAIASRSAALFHDRYLTPAAEACYLRRMIKLYAEVQNFEPKLWKEVELEEGMLAKTPRGYDWEYFSYKEPCNGPPDPNVDASKVDFEE